MSDIEYSVITSDVIKSFDCISENYSLRSNFNISVNLRSASTKCFVPPKPRAEHNIFWILDLEQLALSS